MNDESDRLKEMLAKMHDLNARVLADPQNKGTILKEFYITQMQCSDQQTADFVLLVRSMVLARENENMPENFDHTAHLKAAAPIIMGGMIIAGILGLTCIVGGVYGIYKNAQGTTEIGLFGAHLSTANVGVAFVFIGVVTLGRVVFKAIKRTAAP